jgi:hypothetical protein
MPLEDIEQRGGPTLLRPDDNEIDLHDDTDTVLCPIASL